MFRNLDKKFFRSLVDICEGARLTLIVLSFLIVLYWILQLWGAYFLEPITVFFESIKAFIHTFYQRTVVIDGKEIDFSFLVATFINLGVVWALKHIVESLKNIEKQYFSVKRSLQKKEEDAFNKQLEKEYINHEAQNNKILMLVKYNAIKIKKHELFRKEEIIESEQKECEKNALNDFTKLLLESFKCESNKLEDGVLFYFDKFDKINTIFSQIEQISSLIANKYFEDKWQVEALIAMDSYAKMTEIVLKAKKLKSILNLQLKSKIACLSSLKQRYAILSDKKYAFESQGIYKIDENEEVFTLKPLE